MSFYAQYRYDVLIVVVLLLSIVLAALILRQMRRLR